MKKSKAPPPPEPTYLIEVNEKQLRALSKASELFARIRIGQIDDITWKVFPDKFGKEIDLDFVRSLLDRAFLELRGKHPNSSSDQDWSEDAEILWDLYQVFRYRLFWDRNPTGTPYTVDSNEPLPKTHAIPLATVKRKDS